MADFTHLDSTGQGQMVDVAGKLATARRALVSGQVRVSNQCRQKLSNAMVDEINRTARIAALNGGKQTALLIPYCHQVPLNLLEATIDFDFEEGIFHLSIEASAHASTGVEMEALVAATTAGACIYDMIKAVDPAAVVGPFFVAEKSGGKLGLWQNNRT